MAIEQSKKTVQDVIDSVVRQFGDESGAQITESDIIRWVNEAQRSIVVDNREVNQVIGEFPSVAGTGVYNISQLLPDVIRIHSIMYDGKLIPNLTFEEAQELMLGDATGGPQFWFRYASMVTLWPSPNTDLAQGIRVYYNRAPTLVETSAELLSVPDSYYEGVTSFCLGKAFELDENPQMLGIKKEDYAKNLAANATDVNESFRSYPVIREVD